MIRMQVRLTEEQARLVDRLARREGISKAAVIRRIIDKMIDEEVKSRAIAAVGRLHSGTGDLAARHNHYATEGVDQ